MWKEKLLEEKWRMKKKGNHRPKKSHFQIRFWRGETPVGSSASLSELAPPWRRTYVSGSHWIHKWLKRIFLFAVQQLTDVQDSTRDQSRHLVKTGPIMAGQSHATNLKSHFVFSPHRAPEWLHARFFRVVFLANEGELTGRTFTTSLNTTSPNTNVKFIFFSGLPL